jgi:hypothetical protein
MPSLTGCSVFTPLFDPVFYAVHHGLRLPGPLYGPHMSYCAIPEGPIDECPVCQPYGNLSALLGVHRYDRKYTALLCRNLPHCECGEPASAELVDGSFVCEDCMGEDDEDAVERSFPWVRALRSLEHRMIEFDWDELGTWGQKEERGDEGTDEA